MSTPQVNKEVRRDILIAHLDGPVSYDVRLSARRRATDSLMRLDLLRFHDVSGSRNDRRQTFITEEGRAALAAMLADWADALVRAGFLRLAWERPPPRPQDRIRSGADPGALQAAE